MMTYHYHNNCLTIFFHSFNVVFNNVTWIHIVNKNEWRTIQACQLTISFNQNDIFDLYSQYTEYDIV